MLTLAPDPDPKNSESLFRTVKYCPQWPSEGFENIDDARVWVAKFVAWYNQEHRHSRINYVTPNQRHQGEHNEILNKRTKQNEMQKKRKQTLWPGSTRNWSPGELVDLNPERHENEAA